MKWIYLTHFYPLLARKTDDCEFTRYPKVIHPKWGLQSILTLNFDGRVLRAYSFQRLTRSLLILPHPSLSHLRLPTRSPSTASSVKSALLFTIATTMYGKSRQALSMFRWVTGFLRCCSSNSFPHRELCRDRSQIRDGLHRGRPQPDSEPSQVQLFVGRHVSLCLDSSPFHSSLNEG